MPGFNCLCGLVPFVPFVLLILLMYGIVVSISKACSVRAGSTLDVRVSLFACVFGGQSGMDLDLNHRTCYEELGEG